MAPPDLVEEGGLGVAHVGERLAGLRPWPEDHEIDGVAILECFADLAFRLEAADPGAVTRARIDDHERPPGWIDGHAGRWSDHDERVVDRAGQRAAVEDRLVVEVQHGRHLARLMLVERVAALAQHVEQDSPRCAASGA